MLPDIPCSLELRIHPDVEEIKDQAEAWASKVGLDDYGAGFGCGWLGAACHPDGERIRVEIATNLLQWIFAFDDFVDEPPTADPWLTARQALLSVRVAEDPDHPINVKYEPCLKALDDVSRRLRLVATATQYQRFVAGLTEWVLGQICGDTAHAPLSPTDYSTVRRYNTNGLISYALIDVTLGSVLPDEQWHRPSVARLTRIASDIIGYTNDAFSFAKEHAYSPDAVNFPAVLACHHEISLDAGVTRTIGHVNLLYQQFQDTAADLRSGATPELADYITGLESWLAGQHHWSLRTRRYNQTEEALP